MATIKVTERARRFAKIQGSRRRRMKANFIKAGLDPTYAEAAGAELGDLLEWVERVAEDCRSMTEAGGDLEEGLVRLSIDFAYLEQQIPRFRRAIARARRSLKLPAPIMTKPSASRIRRVS